MAVLLAALLLLPTAGLPAPADTTERVPADSVHVDSVRAVGIARPDTVVPMAEVTVRARRLGESVLAAPRRVTTLGAAEIEASGAQDVAELLAARTGLFVKQYGVGGLATLSARGTSSQQTLVLLDGLSAADPQTGQVDLSLLPTIVLQSAEVAHGMAGARYGSGALGGVVRLQTLDPQRALAVDASASTGSWGERRGGVAVRGGEGAVTGVFAAEASQSEGNFPYENDVLLGTPTVRRRGADRDASTLFGKVRYAAGRRHAFTLTGWHADAERGLPGTTGAQASRARQWDRHLRLAGRYEGQPQWGAAQAALQVQRTYRRYAGPSSADTARTERYALSGEAQTLLAAHWSLAGGAEAAYERAALRGGIGRVHGGAFASATGTWGRLTLYPALRVDAYASGAPSSAASPRAEARRIVALSPSLGASVQPLAWEEVRLKGQLARAFRAPTLNDRFYRPGGNPDLRPEDGFSAEVGAAVDTEAPGPWRVQAEATAFATWLRDQIVWRPSFVAPGVQGWRPQNVAQVRTRGLEASLSARFRPHARLRVGAGSVVTRTYAEDRSDPAARAYGRQLPYVPRTQWKGHANVQWKAPAPLGRFRLGVNGRFVGRRYFTADETRAVPAYQVLDVRLRYRHALGPVEAGLGLHAENVTNQTYAIMRRYPMPPRTLRFQLTLQAAP